MQIFDDTKKRIGTLSGFRNREITRTLDSGDKELVFEYPAHGEMVDLLKEEYYIRTKTDEFVLRAIEKTADWNKYSAQLNVEELEGQSFPYGFASQEQTIRACLEFAFEGTGWTVGTCTVTKKRTIDIEESTTAWSVLQDCLSTYRCECDIDTLNKTVNIYETIGQDRGCYFMEGLNLRKLSINSDTYEFYTRIIPIGKDGITIEWLHGKEYLENYQYSKKIKTYTWKDERYTNTTSLMEDAAAKLDEMSRPYKAYTADVVDLAKANPEYSSVLDYGIGDTVTLVSKRTGTREKQRIVKITEYPETPEKNTVELSNTIKTFAEVQRTETEVAKQEAISIANSTTKKILSENYYNKIEVESYIRASREAIELGVSEKYETKEVVAEKYNDAVQAGQDAAAAAEKAANTATDEKLKEYSTTKEMESAIEMAADSITLSVSEKYETKEVVAEKYNDAVQAGQDAAAAAEKAANTATDEKLKEYSTTKEMESAIEMAADSITLSVSEKYETKEVVAEKYNDAVQAGQDAAAAAEKAANTATEKKLKEYYTKAEIDVKNEEIEATVSKKIGEDELATQIEMNAEAVRIAWNNISKYIQFENAKLNIYNDDGAGGKELLMSLGSDANRFYFGGNYVGKIGTSYWSGHQDWRGLTTSIDQNTKYIVWSRQNDQGVSLVKFTYYTTDDIDKKGFHFYDDVYFSSKIHAGKNAETWININGTSIQMHPGNAENDLDGLEIDCSTGMVFGMGKAYKILVGKSDTVLDTNLKMGTHDITARYINGTLTGSSDARLKANISKGEVDALDAINKIEIKSYDWIESGEHEEIGVIAQQVEKVAPGIVTKKDGSYGININDTVFYLIAAIQQITDLIEKGKYKREEEWKDTIPITEKKKFIENEAKKQKIEKKENISAITEEIEEVPIVIFKERMTEK